MSDYSKISHITDKSYSVQHRICNTNNFGYLNHCSVYDSIARKVSFLTTVQQSYKKIGQWTPYCGSYNSEWYRYYKEYKKNVQAGCLIILH
jgi:hypothetical protein